MSGQIQATLETLPPAQRQEALARLATLSPAQRQEVLDKVKPIPPDQRQGALERFLAGVPNWETGITAPTQGDRPEKSIEPVLEKEDTSGQAIYDLFPPGLTLFGHDLFVDTPNSFIPDAHVAIPTDYRLGPDDSILVQLSGKTFQQLPLLIDREGMLTFPGIGSLSAAGLTFEELKKVLQERVQKQMLGTEIARITLEKLRSLQVFILGDVPHPGSYTVNSLTTATNALFSSGGIKPVGSLRKILVKRQGETISTLDLYSLLLEGDQSGDLRLQSGDTLFVPPIGDVVALTGRVKRPGIYEINHEKTVEEAITLAGGLLPDANTAFVQVDRYQSRQNRILLDLDITKPQFLRFPIQSGDRIHTPPVPELKLNFVTLVGHVTNAGQFQWRKGLHLSDIVQLSQLLPQVDLSYAIITRQERKTGHIVPLTLNLGRALEDPSSPDNVVLKSEDTVQIFGLEEDRANSVQTLVGHLQGQSRFNHQGQVVGLNGHVRFPGDYPFSSGMGLKELLQAAGDVKVGADMEYVLIVRSNKRGEIEPFSVRLSKILDKQSPQDDIPLQPQDQVLVFPAEVVKKRVTDTKNVVDATKKMIENKNRGPDEEKDLRQKLLEPVLTKLRQQALSNTSAKIVLVNGSVRSPGEYPLEANMRVSDLIRASGSMIEPAYTLDAEMSRFSLSPEESREINHTKISLEKIIQGDTVSDLLLQPHDVLLIKRIPQWSALNSVTLEGEVRFPGTYPVKPGETLLQILERAGGFTDYAYPEGAVFMRKNLREREQKETETLANRLEMELAGRDLQSAATEEENRSTSSLLRNLIQRLRDTTPQGRLAIDLPFLLANASHSDTNTEIVLRDQDHLIIPQKVNEITVIGEVFYPTSHQYLPENSIEQYVNLSGGFSQMAEPERIYIVKANGQVVSRSTPTKMFGTAWLSGKNQFPLTPGDTIVVPLKVEKVAPMDLWKDISQVLANIAITTATLKAVGAL